MLAEESFSYLGGTATRMKLRYTLVSWKNIENEKGEPAPFNEESIEKLPSEIHEFLVKRIDKDNGLIRTKKTEEDEKN